MSLLESWRRQLLREQEKKAAAEARIANLTRKIAAAERREARKERG